MASTAKTLVHTTVDTNVKFKNKLYVVITTLKIINGKLDDNASTSKWILQQGMKPAFLKALQKI